MLWSSALRSSSLPYYIFLLREKVRLPYRVPSIDKWYPFQIPSLELCITFSCCKCTVFKLWTNQKTRKLSRLFHSHKILLLALLGLFADQNDTDFPTLSYTSTTPEVWKRYPFRNSGGASRIGHCRGFPLGFMLALLSISMLQNWLFSCVKCLGLYTICEVGGSYCFLFFTLDLDECKDKTHQCDVKANCTNIPGSYNCTCRPGYRGNGRICNGIISYLSLHFIFLQVVLFSL